MEIVIESFQRWFNGNQMTTDDTTNIVMGIILVVLLIALIVMLVYISIQTLFWTCIGWFFEDVWHWMKRHTRTRTERVISKVLGKPSGKAERVNKTSSTPGGRSDAPSSFQEETRQFL